MSNSQLHLVLSLRMIAAIFLLPYGVDRGNLTSYYLLPPLLQFYIFVV